MKNILFVCLGNICRSPAAEGIFKKQIKEAGLENKISCDSAGTSAYHAGQPSDSRMRESAFARGYSLESLSRPFIKEDFDRFDLLVVMDESNYRDVVAMAETPEDIKKIQMMLGYCTIHEGVNEVPDPYYNDKFEYVMDLLEDSCNGLLKSLT